MSLIDLEVLLGSGIDCTRTAIFTNFFYWLCISMKQNYTYNIQHLKHFSEAKSSGQFLSINSFVYQLKM